MNTEAKSVVTGASQITEATLARFAREVAKYPAEQKQSAVMACLSIVQQEPGLGQHRERGRDRQLPGHAPDRGA